MIITIEVHNQPRDQWVAVATVKDGPFIAEALGHPEDTITEAIHSAVDEGLNEFNKMGC